MPLPHRRHEERHGHLRIGRLQSGGARAVPARSVLAAALGTAKAALALRRRRSVCGQKTSVLALPGVLAAVPVTATKMLHLCRRQARRRVPGELPTLQQTMPQSLTNGVRARQTAAQVRGGATARARGDATRRPLDASAAGAASRQTGPQAATGQGATPVSASEGTRSTIGRTRGTSKGTWNARGGTGSAREGTRNARRKPQNEGGHLSGACPQSSAGPRGSYAQLIATGGALLRDAVQWAGDGRGQNAVGAALAPGQTLDAPREALRTATAPGSARGPGAALALDLTIDLTLGTARGWMPPHWCPAGRA